MLKYFTQNNNTIIKQVQSNQITKKNKSLKQYKLLQNLKIRNLNMFISCLYIQDIKKIIQNLVCVFRKKTNKKVL